MKSTELNDQQLGEIEGFAYAYLEKWEISRIMELEDPESFDDEDNPVYAAFWKGRLKRKARYNNNVIALSDQLSSPAQAIEAKIAERITLNDSKKITR